MKYQISSLKLNNHKKSQFVEMAVFNNKNVLQSTLLAEATTSNSSLDISAIKPNKDEFKNKESYESPGKIFQRMKEKVLRNKQEQASRNSFWNQHKMKVSLLMELRKEYYSIPTSVKKRKTTDHSSQKTVH